MATKALQMRVDELEKLVVSLNEKITSIESQPIKKEAITTTKKESKGLKKDGTPRKKRAPCGYMIFSNENRVEVREQLVAEADGEKVPPGAVVKKLAEMWNALGDEEKEPFNTRAKEMAESDEE
jgi:hypothetical protein|uniref:Class II HMG-box domain containing protein n=1 Tax=Nucleocytoviricota sp. TaxID=2809609 RepID=A0A9E8GAW4_9VIRU|nr:class II HMG-box domain containing protein [Nucleocytoviricota sp.]UZT29298.1 class II HMG-box domain containing protein [Nucleocytoviricota sp.]